MERDATPQQVHSSRVILLEPDEEGLIVLILASLYISMLVDAGRVVEQALASSDKTVGGSCCGSNSLVRRGGGVTRKTRRHAPPTRIHLLHLYLKGISVLSSIA